MEIKSKKRNVLEFILNILAFFLVTSINVIIYIKSKDAYVIVLFGILEFICLISTVLNSIAYLMTSKKRYILKNISKTFTKAITTIINMYLTYFLFKLKLNVIYLILMTTTTILIYILESIFGSLEYVFKWFNNVNKLLTFTQLSICLLQILLILLFI